MVVSVRSDVRLFCPLDDGERWIIENPYGERFGISEDVACVFDALRKTPDMSLVYDRFGRDNVDQVVELLSEHEIFSDTGLETISSSTSNRNFREWGRLRIASPFSIQLTLLRNPSKIFTPFMGFGHLQWMAAAAVALVLSFAGLVGIALDFETLMHDLVTPQTIGNYLWMLLMTVFIISLHEYMHGAVLNSFGGRVSRMGIMLFYMAPACFCDVSDGWRMSAKKRISVACAGVISTFMLAGICALLRFIPNMPSSTASLVVSLYVGAIINAIPTVKFDGYIALMAWKEEPFLRDKAMEQWKDFLASLFNQDHHARISVLRIVYGMLCSATPLVLIYSLYVAATESMGSSTAGQVASALLLWILVWLVIRGWGKMIYRCASDTTKNKRIVWSVAVICSIVMASTVLLIPVEMKRSTVYSYKGNGILSIVLPSGEQIAVNTVLQVKQQGLIASRYIGEAYVIDEPQEMEVPADVFSPSINWPFNSTVIARTQRAFFVNFKEFVIPVKGRISWIDRKKIFIQWLFEQLIRNPYKALMEK